MDGVGASPARPRSPAAWIQAVPHHVSRTLPREALDMPRLSFPKLEPPVNRDQGPHAAPRMCHRRLLTREESRIVRLEQVQSRQVEADGPLEASIGDVVLVLGWWRRWSGFRGFFRCWFRLRGFFGLRRGLRRRRRFWSWRGILDSLHVAWRTHVGFRVHGVSGCDAASLGIFLRERPAARLGDCFQVQGLEENSHTVIYCSQYILYIAPSVKCLVYIHIT